MNSFQLVGRVLGEPATQITGNGTAMTKFVVAVERSFVAEGKKPERDYLDLVAWGNRAEEAGKLTHGQRVEVTGRITTRKWKNENQEDRKSTDLTVEWLRSLERPAAEPQATPKPKPQPRKQEEEEDPFQDD